VPFNFKEASLNYVVKLKASNNYLFHKINPTKVFSAYYPISNTSITQKFSLGKNLPKNELLLSILIENTFINSRKQNNLKPSKVLSKAPSYKMDDTSAITADRHRGNFYSR